MLLMVICYSSEQAVQPVQGRTRSSGARVLARCGRHAVRSNSQGAHGMEPIVAVWCVLALLLGLGAIAVASLLWDRFRRDGNQP